MNETCSAEIGSGTPRKPVISLNNFYEAIDYTEKALEEGTKPEEIEENLLKLYTPVARQEYGTRRHQMTFVAVLIATQALKAVEALKERVAALESTPAPVAKPARKKKDQLKRAVKKRPTKKVTKKPARKKFMY